MARQPTPYASDEDREKSKRIGALRELAPFLSPYRWLAFFAGIALVLTASVSLVLPIAVRRVVDNFNTANAELLNSYFMAAIGVAGLLAVGNRTEVHVGDQARRKRGR